MKGCDTNDDVGLCLPGDVPNEVAVEDSPAALDFETESDPLGDTSGSSGSEGGLSEHVAAPPPKLEVPLPSSYSDYFPDGSLPDSLTAPGLGELSGKLLNFLRRPALSHGDAFEVNNAACPPALSDALVNPDQLKGNRDFWERVNEDEIVRRRAELVQYIADRAVTETVVGEAGKGKRGIVFTAGNKVGIGSVLC